MVKRVAASVLWFLVLGTTWNWFALVSGVPSAFGLLLAAASAGLVGFDPLHVIWSREVRRTEPAVATAVRRTLRTHA